MKILVTGGRGFIGSYLMSLLKSEGQIVKSFDLKDGLDIRDKKKLAKYMRGVDVVVHLAAQTSIAHAWNDPVDYYSHNILGTANVIETAIRFGVKKIVYASSASVYQPLDNPYSLSKSICENLFLLRKDKMSFFSFRFMNVYGKGQNRAYGTVIPAFYEGIKNGTGIKVYGDGKQTRDFIHVKDVAMALSLAIRGDYPMGFYDLGSGVGISVNELANLFQKLLNKRAKITHIPPRAEVRHSKADIRFIKKFELMPKIKLIDGLKEVIKKGI